MEEIGVKYAPGQSEVLDMANDGGSRHAAEDVWQAAIFKVRSRRNIAFPFFL